MGKTNSNSYKSPIRYKQITHLIFLICFAFYNIVAYAAPGAIKGKVTGTDGLRNRRCKRD